MSFKYAAYVVPALGTLCAAGAVAVMVSARAPMDSDFAVGSAEIYEARIPQNLEPDNNIPNMEQVVEKHLFVKERKATGANTFPDLLIKGVYVGEKQSVVLSLKSRPEINLRVWLDDIDGIISRITNPRDPRRTIIDFLNEWDIRELSVYGMTVEHFFTGEVETYAIDYTPEKHTKDDAAAGYGQGALAQSSLSSRETATKAKQSKKQTASTSSSQAMQRRMQAMGELRNMVENMTPEQRERFAERIKGTDQGQQQNNGQGSSRNSSRNSSSGNSAKSR